MGDNHMDTAPLLRVQDLKVHFPIEKGVLIKRRVGWIRAVNGVNFELHPGESLGLVGESGCGKSTTAMAVAQLQRITAGNVLFQGRDLTALTPEELRRERMKFQVVFQDPYSSLNPRMRIGDVVAEPLRIYARLGIISMSDAAIKEKAASLLERCGLSPSFAHRYPHEFSGGQRQRIGIARALALGPKLVLADEPVSALDVSIQSQILNLLKDLQTEFDLTFLFIAHDLAVVEYFCSRVAVMYLGHIVETGDSESLYRNPLHPYTQALLAAIPLPDPQRERERNRRRTILGGDVPSPAVERRGCPFVDRCPRAMERCRNQAPVPISMAPGHEVSCFLYDGSDGKGNKDEAL